MTSPSEPRSGTTPPDQPSGPDADPGDRPAPPGRLEPVRTEAPSGVKVDTDGTLPAEATPDGGAAADAEAAAEGDAASPEQARPRRKKRKRKAEGDAGDASGAGGPGDASGAAGGADSAANGATAGAEPGGRAAAKTELGPLGELREAYLRVDRRLLALFRVYFGLVLLGDVLRRVPEADIFYSSSGVMTNHYSLFAPLIKPYLSLYTAFSTPGEVRFAFLATALVYVFYLVGYRTRLMQVLAFFLYANLNARNTFLENGGTVVFAIVACWTMFLPLGDRFSVDAVLKSLRARRERAPEALNERAAFRAPTTAHYSIVVLAVTVQIAAIYFFNTVHKTGVTWKRGESIHWVLWQNRIATHLAAWLRMHEPSWLSPVLTKATLIIEGAAPVLAFSPFAQKYLRTLHVFLACSLHVGIALLMTLGPFSYVMIALNLLLLPSAVFDWVGARWAERKPRLVVAYDPSDAGLHRLARLLSRLDSLDRLRFVAAADAPGGAPEGGGFFARAEGETGAWSEGAAALVACLRALPFGSLAGLPPTRALADRYFARRAAPPLDAPAPASVSAPGLAAELALAPGPAAALAPASGPAAELAPGPSPLWRSFRQLGFWASEGVVSVLLVVALIQISHDNAWVPRKLRFEQPAALEPVVLYPRLLQGWRMFSPDAPKEDGTIVVDAVTIDGRHLDPFTGQAPDFEAPLHGPWYQSQLWCDYFLRISWDTNSGYRDELKRYLLNWHRLERRPANDRIKSFEVWWVSNDAPPPGKTLPFNIKKRLVSSGGPT